VVWVFAAITPEVPLAISVELGYSRANLETSTLLVDFVTVASPGGYH
jgi:hypothetical protein